MRTKALGPGKRVRLQPTVSTSGRTDAGIAQDMVLRQRQQTTVRLPGYTGANNDNAAVQTYLVNRNASGGTPSALALNNVAGGAPGFANTAGGAACPVP